MKRLPGGLSGRPVITSITKGTNVTVNWTGFGAPYEIERCPAIGDTNWVTVGTTSTKSFTFTPEGELGFLRVKGKSPNFAGADTCKICHIDTHASWLDTAHKRALESLKAAGQDKNARCLECHTVGAGLPTGFIDEATTPHLAGVQCENCHGAAGDHATRPLTKSLRPLKTMAAEMCGGCHTGYHHPTYDEWETSKHARVSDAPAHYFVDPAVGQARMLACGACHSGAVRGAMVRGYDVGDPVELPTGEEAANVAITCAVCHNPHAKTTNPAQLRNPVKSMKGFTYSTAATTTFAAQYDPEVNICGQCHNSRGARWQDGGRYPHYSPQYNMVVGNGGADDPTLPVQNSRHRDNSMQCAGCHTHGHEPSTVSASNPVFTGHDFKPSAEACLTCHTSKAMVENLKNGTIEDTKERIEGVVRLLATWAQTKAPDALRKYGEFAWEYSTPGHLAEVGSNKTPTSAEQPLIPDNIKKARFNAYLVYQDGSFGVHNGEYARYLLDVAERFIRIELAK